MNRIYYNQGDKRWGSHKYPSKLYPNATVKSSGCAPTSAAMVISSFIKTVYPNEMADLFKNNGFRVETGTDSAAFNWIAREYDLDMKRSVYIAEAVECLKRGGMVIALCKAGSLFSTGGHFIVLSEIRGDNLVVFDPYLYTGKFNNGNRKCVTVNGNEAIVSVDNFKKYCNYTLYCYEAPYKEEPSKYVAGDIVEVCIPIILTGAREGSDVLVETNGYQYWVNETVIQGNRIIARATVCYGTKDKCIIQIFARQFWCDNEYIVKKL